MVEDKLLKPDKDVGIIGYGAYVPMYRIKSEEISRVWGNLSEPVKEKSVPGPDEDSVTIGIEAAKYALSRSEIDPKELRAIWTGSESPPYAVKPSSTIIADAVGADPDLNAADFEFACKAGTEALQSSIGFVGSGMSKYAMAIGSDTSQGRPEDALEYTAAAGGAAFIIGENNDQSLAKIEGSYSYVTNTPDFWRRKQEKYPNHASRFTGKPAYFKHIINAANTLMDEMETKPEDYDYAVFHQPNTKFPKKAAKILGFDQEKIKPGLLTNEIGNTYSGATLVGMAAVLDQAEPGDKVLWVAFGSGAGSDAFSIKVNEGIKEKRDKAPKVERFVERNKEIDYSIYAKYREKIQM